MDFLRRKFIAKYTNNIFAILLSFKLVSAVNKINFDNNKENMKIIKSSSNPTISTNPSSTGVYFLNLTTGELFVNTDATSDSNVWISTGTGTTTF